MPRYGQEARRGYFLSNGGYYFALTDYFDLKLTGTAYTNGTWLADAATTYKLRYRFSGSFGFSYANNITSYKGLPDYGKTTNYRLNMVTFPGRQSESRLTLLGQRQHELERV